MSIAALIVNVVYLLFLSYYLAKSGLPESEHLVALAVFLLCPIMNLIALILGLRTKKHLRAKIKTLSGNA
ncbi:MAG: hypothetical protein ACYS9T_06795 [Planctomycetota bacterium]|jgi:hypothetical protein